MNCYTPLYYIINKKTVSDPNYLEIPNHLESLFYQIKANGCINYMQTLHNLKVMV
jgi:hypothetical protein